MIGLNSVCMCVCLMFSFYECIVWLRFDTCVLSMSKKTDHFETAGNMDSEKKSLEDASEEMVRERILTGTPIPHPEDAPQSKQELHLFSCSSFQKDFDL